MDDDSTDGTGSGLLAVCRGDARVRMLRRIRGAVFGVLFCAEIELRQVPLPTRHAHVSDFLSDTVGACFAILCIFPTNIKPYPREACES